MVSNSPGFWQILLGGGSVGAFLAYTVIALVCALICFLIGVAKRDVASDSTPVKFSSRYLFVANAARLLANILSIPVLVRLFYEYIDPRWMIGLSAVIGIVVDQLALALKDAGILVFKKATEQIKTKVDAIDHIIVSPKKDQP